VTAQHGSFLATRRGRLTLLLLCAVQFLDVADSSIMNVALPSIRRDLGFSVQLAAAIIALRAANTRGEPPGRPVQLPGSHDRMPAAEVTD
jgi:hypothetical protein